MLFFVLIRLLFLLLFLLFFLELSPFLIAEFCVLFFVFFFWVVVTRTIKNLEFAILIKHSQDKKHEILNGD
jgi:small-conductance mechanosensitive channel